MKKAALSEPLRLALFFALTLTIPAFYLMLTNSVAAYRGLGSALYLVAAAVISIVLALQWRRWHHARDVWRESRWDVLLACAALASAWPTVAPWPMLEWVLRLGFCGIAFLRMATLLAKWMAPHHLFQILGIAAVLLAIAGGGFYWLEPKVLSYADGLWLAFTTGATVGYGDLVPTTHASRIFATFIVLLGYAVFSVATASIAALFVNEDEKRFEKELHADIRALRQEILSLRAELICAKPAEKQVAADQSA